MTDLSMCWGQAATLTHTLSQPSGLACSPLRTSRDPLPPRLPGGPSQGRFTGRVLWERRFRLIRASHLAQRVRSVNIGCKNGWMDVWMDGFTRASTPQADHPADPGAKPPWQLLGVSAEPVGRGRPPGSPRLHLAPPSPRPSSGRRRGAFWEV